MTRTFALGITLILSLSAGCARPPEVTETAPPAVPVEILVVSPQVVRETIELTAILEAYQAVDVVSEVTGTVEKLHHDMGDRVSAGAVLATLDREVPRANLRQAEAALAAARARAHVAANDYVRDSTLFATGDIAEAVLEASRMARQTSRADMHAAEATRQLAARQLRETEIRAPFAGYVSRREVDRGTFVTTGMPLFRVVDVDSLRLRLGISQRNLPRIRPGQEVLVSADAFGERAFSGNVRRISPEADEMTRTFAVEVILPNPPGLPLKDGLVVSATLMLEQLPDVIAVPKDTVLRDETRFFVFVAGDSVAERRSVTCGRTVGDRTIILDGLAPGDRLVQVGMGNLRNGSAILVERTTGGAGS